MENSKEVFVKTTNISEKLETEKIREKLENQREKRRLVEKFKQVKSLADSDDSEEDAAEWYERTKRMRKNDDSSDKKNVTSSSKNDNHPRLSHQKSYTSNQLKGLAIGHKVDSIQEGQQIVLTLRDKDVLNEDEDVLENVNLIDDEKAAKNVENKTKRPEYKPYDDDEFDEFGIYKKPSLLNKYDEEIEGPQTEMFRIGSTIQKSNSSLKIDDDFNGSNNKISLNWNDLKIANEYYTQEEMVKFKKPSKKKGNLRKRNQMNSTHNNTFNHEELIAENSIAEQKRTGSGKMKMELDINKIDDNLIGPEEDLSGFVIDDEAENELQNVLHKARKIKLKEKFIDPALNIAKIVENIKQEKLENIDQDDNSTDSHHIVLNATAEFCRNLGEITTLTNNEKYQKDVMNDDDDDDDMEISNDGIPKNMPPIHSDDDSNDDSKYRNNWNEVDVKSEEFEDTSNSERPVRSQPILEEEPDVSVGVAGALKLAMTKGYLDKETGKSFGATRASSILQAQTYTIEEKFYDDDRLGRRDRYSGPIQEFREKDNYRPDFKLDYVDEKGRMMNQKEAFRYLSHKFHGKGPGKNKIDKRMKKMEQESKLRQMSSTDTPLNTVKLLQDKQKELQTPYIVLSGQRTSNNSITHISKSK